MRYARLVPIAAAVILVLNLLMVSGADVSAAQRGNDLCVAVSGGTVLNETVLDVVADGGTAIGDVSGGNGNLALTANGGNENATDNGNNGNGNNHDDNGNHNNNNNNNNNHDNNGNGNNNRHDDNGNGRNKNRNDWSAQPLDVLEQR